MVIHWIEQETWIGLIQIVNIVAFYIHFVIRKRNFTLLRKYEAYPLLTYQND